MKALPKLKSLSVVSLIFLAAVVIIWLTVIKNPLARPKTQSANEQSNGETVAIVGGTRVAVAEIEKQIKGDLSRMQSDLYNLKRRAVNDAVARILLEQEAKKRGTTVEELTRLEIDAKAAPITAEDRKAEYSRLKERFDNKSDEELNKMADEILHRRRVSERGRQFVSELRSKTDVEVLLEPPRLDVDTNDDPSLGPATAPVTIVEFSEFQCPYCAQVQPTLKQLKQRFGDKIRIVFRNYPLPIHKDAAKAAEAATCANDQGKFWEMHDKLFANAPKLEMSELKKYAGELGLQMDQFSQCLDSGKYSAKWQADKTEGNSYGVRGTPAFFINGQMVGGAVPFEDFVQMIEEELRRVEGAPKLAKN